jgi:NADH-quinone oxidoreductase subunit A
LSLPRPSLNLPPNVLMPDQPYLFLALFALVAVAVPLVLLGVAQLWFRFFQPAKPGAEKNSVYECGVPPTGDSWIQFKAHYYLFAILFLIFDVEVLFLLPFAVAFSGLPVGALLAMLVFILLLAEGLVWAWHRGHLEWK